MRLIVGGAAQGKLAFALRETGLSPEQVTCGDRCPLCARDGIRLLNGAHLLIRRCMEAGGDPAALLEELVRRNPELVILADEIGCGVVPIDRFEREWRETTGRVCCQLAAKAERVDRVFCGIAVTIKGDATCKLR